MKDSVNVMITLQEKVAIFWVTELEHFSSVLLLDECFPVCLAISWAI